MREWIKYALVVLMLGCLVACDDDDGGGGGGDGDAATVTGTWSGTFSGSGSPFTLSISQSGDAVTGNYSEGGINGTVSGSVSGNSIQMTITLESGSVGLFSGNLNEDRTSMNGTFSIISGGGGGGSWSATKSGSL